MKQVGAGDDTGGWKRWALLAAAVLCYFLAIRPLIYFVAFVANLPVPKTIDRGAPGPLLPALGVNVLLIGSFGFVARPPRRPAD